MQNGSLTRAVVHGAIETHRSGFEQKMVMMMSYETAEQWRDAAMQRENGVDAEESGRRREMVRRHYLREGSGHDADQLADHELYILGKMELGEYEQYLLFKHGTKL